MDCNEIMELLDAYALGATAKPEAESIERHVAECVRCWEELDEAQRAAALIALSLPIHSPSDSLGRRILAAAQRDIPRKLRSPHAVPGGAVARRRSPWLAAAGVAALVFASFLQVQMADLRHDKNDLAQQVSDLRAHNEAADAQLEQQRQIMAVLSHPDTQSVPMTPTSSTSRASAVYGWSRSRGQAFILCQGLPALKPGQVYQAWFAIGTDYLPARIFSTSDGTCLIPMDVGWLTGRPSGIGITIEPEGGSDQPSGQWVLYATFE